ncbi:hypothetical protein [Nostoc commune]|uniref:hypothetical protein n=1 Tax=Nostoc commune TaxID=1178 RepID=UPI000D59C8C0|nr:hypothetical protein [Nostoc commune]
MEILTSEAGMGMRGRGDEGAGGAGEAGEAGEEELLINAQCPMPNAQCPMPNAPFPTMVFE